MVRQVVSEIDELAGTITLDDGRVFNLSNIPGNGWNQNRLGKLNDAIQALVDKVSPLADLPVDDPDKTATLAELQAQYGNRRFLDGQGNIVDHVVEVSFTTDEGGNLVPHHRKVR